MGLSLVRLVSAALICSSVGCSALPHDEAVVRGRISAIVQEGFTYAVTVSAENVGEIAVSMAPCDDFLQIRRNGEWVALESNLPCQADPTVVAPNGAVHVTLHGFTLTRGELVRLVTARAFPSQEWPDDGPEAPVSVPFVVP